jgi:hypothetical protein
MAPGCGADRTPERPIAAPYNWEADTGTVTALENVSVELPQAGHVALVETYCVPCHSLSYIEMQPAMSYKAWEKIVDKMINTYGAPVRDSVTRKDIINYLWAIKGTK